MKKTEELRGKIKQAAERAEDQNTEDMGSWEHFKELLVEEILKACKEAGLRFVEVIIDDSTQYNTPEMATHTEIEEIDA